MITSCSSAAESLDTLPQYLAGKWEDLKRDHEQQTAFGLWHGGPDSPPAKNPAARRLDERRSKNIKVQVHRASIRELGLIEPLVGVPAAEIGWELHAADGHVRHMILKTLGESSAKCLVAADDEGFTYNHKISRLSAIQEHFMIMRAIKNGVSEERIARSLDVDLNTIRQKRDMLDGICPEVVKILKDRRATGKTFRQLRRLKPIRQIEWLN